MSTDDLPEPSIASNADSDVAARLDKLESELADVRAENAQLADRVFELERENEELRDELGTSKDDIDRAHRNIADVRSEITEMQGIGDSVETDTELEVALQRSPEERESYYSVAEQRAVVIAQALPSLGGDKGTKVQTDLKDAVEDERGEDVQWTQIYRACEALESMSDGAIVYIDDDPNRLRVDDETVLA
jgi:predicted RNase H-like nuclease (RuvC/YqgF family)